MSYLELYINVCEERGIILENKTRVKGKDNITEERIRALMGAQKNAMKANEREGMETALDRALKGSKIYLKAQGFLPEEGDEHV